MTDEVRLVPMRVANDGDGAYLAPAFPDAWVRGITEEERHVLIEALHISIEEKGPQREDDALLDKLAAFGGSND
jgi:hypothetical protein